MIGIFTFNCVCPRLQCSIHGGVHLSIVLLGLQQCLVEDMLWQLQGTLRHGTKLKPSEQRKRCGRQSRGWEGGSSREVFLLPLSNFYIHTASTIFQKVRKGLFWQIWRIFWSGNITFNLLNRILEDLFWFRAAIGQRACVHTRLQWTKTTLKIYKNLH